MQPVKASSGLVPIKAGKDTSIYGGYNKPTATFFTLVSHQLKNKKELTFIPVDLLVANRFREDKDFALQYVSEALGGKSSNIQFPLGERVLKVNTVLSLDGFKVAISGKANGGDLVLLRSLETCSFTTEENRYIKNIERVLEKARINKKYTIDPMFDGVSKEQNVKLFNAIVDKTNGFYAKMPGAQIKLEEASFIRFHSLSLEEQVNVLSNMIEYLKTNRAGSCDVSLIKDKAKAAGTLRLSSNVSNWKYKDVRIIDQSASSLFESKSINLKALL